MENLGVETVGETWGWFQIRPLEIYMYIYIYISPQGPDTTTVISIRGSKVLPKESAAEK